MAKILCCGIVTLDIVNHVPHYPAEDEELRATKQQRRSGGNAANTAIVLGRLGHEAALAATVADDDAGDWLLARLRRAGIDTSACRRHPGSTPTSHIALSAATGSRTIIHHRNLAELTAAELAAGLPDELDWLHFEGRNVPELEKMLAALPTPRRHRVSIEAEKPRQGLEALFDRADLVMISRPWAEAAGHDDAASALQTLHDRHPGQRFSCTWGAAGAWHCDRDGRIVHTPAMPLAKVVDSIGAGDTFNAGVIDGLVRGRSLADAVAHGVELAAASLTIEGIGGEAQHSR